MKTPHRDLRGHVCLSRLTERLGVDLSAIFRGGRGFVAQCHVAVIYFYPCSARVLGGHYVPGRALKLENQSLRHMPCPREGPARCRGSEPRLDQSTAGGMEPALGVRAGTSLRPPRSILQGNT